MADGPVANPTLKAACTALGFEFNEETQSCILPAGPGGTLPTTKPGKHELPTGHVVIPSSELAALEAKCESFKSQRIMWGVGGVVVGGVLGYLVGR